MCNKLVVFFAALIGSFVGTILGLAVFILVNILIETNHLG